MRKWTERESGWEGKAVNKKWEEVRRGCWVVEERDKEGQGVLDVDSPFLCAWENAAEPLHMQNDRVVSSLLVTKWLVRRGPWILSL